MESLKTFQVDPIIKVLFLKTFTRWNTFPLFITNVMEGAGNQIQRCDVRPPGGFLLIDQFVTISAAAAIT